MLFNYTNSIIITFNNLSVITKKICFQISKYSKDYGIIFDIPNIYEIKNYQNDEIIKEIENINLNNNLQMVIFILDKKRKNLYPYIKNYLYTKKGIVSQFILYSEKKNSLGKKYYGKIISQMIVKAKGQLFNIKFPDKILNEKYVFIGIDYKIIQNKNQIALCASYNRNFNKFFTEIKTEKNGESSIEFLIKSMIEQFKYSNINKILSIKRLKLIINHHTINPKEEKIGFNFIRDINI